MINFDFYNFIFFDLELSLYSKILKNDMLHYGYFKDPAIKPETMSLEHLESAQIDYSEYIIENISNLKDTILDLGCGMGGLAKLISDKNLQVEVITPNVNQIEYIRHKYKNITSHHSKFEHFESADKFGTIINSESLQYINLDDAFAKIDKYLLPDGRWIVVDYFRLNSLGTTNTGHLLDTFRDKLTMHDWCVVHEKDITLNVLPTLMFINMYIDRFLIPLKHYGFEKFFKKSILHFLS